MTDKTPTAQETVVANLVALKERTIMRYGLHPDADAIQAALDYITTLEAASVQPKPKAGK